MRPKKLTEEKFAKILTEIEGGHTITQACEKVGVGRSTLYRELNANRDKRDALKKVEEQRDMMITNEAIQAIYAAFGSDWRAAAWWLERNHPARYSLRNDLRPQGAEKHVTTEEEWMEMLRDSPELRRHLGCMIDRAEGEASEGLGRAA